MSLASGRRGAVSHSAAFARDLLEGLQRALAPSSPCVSAAPAAGVASNPASRGASRQPSPVRVASPACPTLEQPSSVQQYPIGSSASASGASVVPPTPQPVRLTQRRGAVAHFSSQLRMALRLPLTPTLTPCPSPGPQTPAGAAPNGSSAAATTLPSYPSPTAWCTPSHLSATSGLVPPRRSSAPLSPGLSLPFQRYPSPAPRLPANSVPATASSTNNDQQQQHHLIAPRPQQATVTASPITGPVRRLEITLDPAGSMEPLPSPVSIPPSSATPPIRAPSPRVMMMSTFFTNNSHATSVTPPPFDAASSSGRGTPSSSSQQRSSRLRRRRTAIIAHGDFTDSIPEEWRNADELGEDESAAPQIVPREEATISPRIRARRASTSASHGRGGIPLNARRTLLSVDLDRIVPAPPPQISHGFTSSSPYSNSELGSSTTPVGLGNLDASHTPFFSPSSAHSNVSSTGTSSVLGVCSIQSVDSTTTPLSSSSFTSPLSGAISAPAAAAPLPLTYRRHSVTGTMMGASTSSHPRIFF